MKKFLAIVVMTAGLWSSAGAHGVKDPVCRMDVDTHATAYQKEFKGQTYYFCSSACQKRFEASPEQYVKTLEILSKGGKSFEVQVKTAKEARAGEPVGMTITIVSGAEKTPVKSYEVVHEQLMHLVMVSEDLSWFAHEHPTPKPEGSFDFTGTFPGGGRYFLYTDFTPADGDNQLLRTVLDVGGKAKMNVVLAADTSLEKAVGVYRVKLVMDPASLQVEKTATLTYAILDAKGNPVTDMEPYLGAMGHLFAVHQAGEVVVHTHAISKSSDGHNHQQHQADAHSMKKSIVPTISFKLSLPKEGLYKVWAQFGHRGKVLTIPFVLDVKPLWDKPHAQH